MKKTSTSPMTTRIKNGSSGVVMTRYVKIEDMDRSFDIEFWQAQDATARLNAAWELVEFYHTLKGERVALRLQRTVAFLQRIPELEY
jgi:hypothetical protein